MNNYYPTHAIGGGVSGWMHGFGFVIIFLVLWTLFWKGLALWHSARKGQPWWFAIMLAVNTIGILEIIYLFLVIKLKPENLFSNKKA